MKRYDIKSHCAVNFALETIGDPWSLLIVRDIAFDGKHTFNEFLASKERIAKNILASRLVKLEQVGIIEKRNDPTDHRKSIYTLTSKGIDLIPVLFELSSWSVKHDPDTAANKDFGEQYHKDKGRITRLVQDAVQEGRAAFAGQDSVISQLATAFTP